MAILNPYLYLGLPIGIGMLYAGEAWKRQRTDNQKACTSLATLWSIWTLASLGYAVMLIPPPPPGPGEPIQLPTPETLFSIAVYFVFLPAFAVWVLMMLDLIVYVLKTRYRFRAANQSESKQVEALPSL
jgi:hypothetical protein